MRISDALELTHQGTPATPVSTRTLLYVKGDNRVYTKRGDGTEVDVSSWDNVSGKPTSFTPSAHAASHRIGGTDVLTPSDIGASSTAHGHVGVYAGVNHTHSDYAATTHNHDTAYATTGHTHTGYAATGHNHDAAYATAGHSHSGYESTIAGGTTAQYWRGDKTWQTLNKAAVGLGSVDNTADADKPVSGPVALALATKLNNPADSGQITVSGTFAGYVRFVKIGPLVLVVGEITRATGFSTSFTNIGVTAAAQFFPDGAVTLSASPFFNATGSYRFRITTGGSLDLQQTATTSQTMTLNGFYPAATP